MSIFGPQKCSLCLLKCYTVCQSYVHLLYWPGCSYIFQWQVTVTLAGQSLGKLEFTNTSQIKLDQTTPTFCCLLYSYNWLCEIVWLLTALIDSLFGTNLWDLPHTSGFVFYMDYGLISCPLIIGFPGICSFCCAWIILIINFELQSFCSHVTTHLGGPVRYH